MVDKAQKLVWGDIIRGHAMPLPCLGMQINHP